MPTQSAFDVEQEMQLVHTNSYKKIKERDAEQLLSAIPAMPAGNEDKVMESGRKTRMRQMMVALVAALALVAGTALFITRPWDPDAYVTHATEDADTSMEGFPGEVSHLTSQDHTKDVERKEYEQQMSAALDAYFEHLGAIADRADELEASLDTLVNSGTTDGANDGLKKARELAAELSLATEEVQGYDLTLSAAQDRKDELLVMAGYLKGELDALVDVWMALTRASNPTQAAIDARSALGTQVDGRTLQEWHDLFRNAYRT